MTQKPTRTAHWRSLRLRAFARSGGNCERCGVPLEHGAWHCHHLTYERRGQERLSDVQAICLNCHRVIHPHREFRSVHAQRQIAARRKAQRAEIIARHRPKSKGKHRNDPRRKPFYAPDYNDWREAMGRDR